MLGIYDVNTEVYSLIQLNILDFAVSQQQYIQASMVVVMASLFVTTGENLVVPSDSGAYLSGPNLITSSNLPSDELQICTGDGFPICPNAGTPPGDEPLCPCTDRQTINLVAATHATTTDIFW